MDEIISALAAPARRTLIDELRERNGQTLFELCTRLTMLRGLGLSRQAISQHLDVLESVGLVRSERQGKYRFFYINTGPLRALADWCLAEVKGDGQ
ncbi:MAG: ArsR/SmtB family transcription factor [Chloroflexota bacterium]